MLPPESPNQSPYKCPPAVGIPDPKPVRAIKNTDEDKFNEGYDSDGEIGPFFDAVEDEINADVEVDDVDDGLPTSMGGDGTDAAPSPSDTSSDWFIEGSDIMRMTADVLKKEIRRRCVVPKGNKKPLQIMLTEIVEKRMPIVDGGPDKNAEALGGFPVGSTWKMLEPNEDIVEVPFNEFEFRPPTLQPNETPTTVKRNYDENFDRPVFAGRNKKGEVRLKGEVRSAFLLDEGLDLNSHPADWADAFFPVYEVKRKS